MSPEARKPGSLGLTPHWLTVGTSRRVLAVARTLTSLTRLLDVLSLLESDHRVQVFFTFDDQNPAILGSGLAEYLRRLDAPVISWHDACHSRFDLAVAASENDRLDQLNAPVLLLPHGIGFQKYYPGTRIVAGMDPGRLVRDGLVIPATLALSHQDQQRQLHAHCPQAVPRSVVVGDPCLDHLLAFTHHAQRYRSMLGARGRTIVLLASTWGPDSLFGRMTDLPQRLLSELPADQYVVALVLHPGVYAAHSTWQLRSWLADAARAGLIIVPPDGAWRPVLLAADCVIADSGSLALYAASVGKPLLVTGPASTVVERSPIAELMVRAPHVDRHRPLRSQVDEAISSHTASDYADIVRQAADHPGECAERLRPLLYRLMLLPEPSHSAIFPPFQGFHPEVPTVSAYVTGVEEASVDLALSRYPALPVGDPKLEYRHITAHLEFASLTELDAAAIIYLPADASTTWDAAASTLWQWPHADAVALSVAVGTCLVWTTEGSGFRLSTAAADLDPLLLASVVHVRRVQGRRIADVERIQVGDRVIDVRVDRVAQVASDSGKPSGVPC